MFPEQIVPEALPVPHARASRPATVDLWRLQLLLVLTLSVPAALAAPLSGGAADSAPQVLDAGVHSGLAEDGDDEEDDSADYPDDGSGALRDQPADPVPERLLPISTTEEKRLLGDWGDSAAEAED